MYASHDSLQHLYEVSGAELDAIVDFCRTYKDCIGARMTGAGFGGCAIALIKKIVLTILLKKYRQIMRRGLAISQAFSPQ